MCVCVCVAGADLIYGPKAEDAMTSLLVTISALLRAPEAAVSSEVIHADMDTDTDMDRDTDTDTLNGRKGHHHSDGGGSVSDSALLGGVSAGCVRGGPSFLLAYMRSGSVPLECFLEEAGRHGLRAEVLEDYTW
jgi:hypothetical protein